MKMNPINPWLWLVLLLAIAQNCPSMTATAQGTDGGNGPNDAQTPTCPLDCKDGSACVDGEASFIGHPTDGDDEALSMHHNTSVDGHHCECNPGFTGVDCSVGYESCADATSDHACYHGGICLPTHDNLGNSQYQCDCSKAQSNDELPYRGKYCDVPAGQICGDPNDPHHSFCMNDGKCPEDNTNVSCECPPEFVGVHCEYAKEDYPDCDLVCRNGGRCQVGVPPVDNAEAYNYWQESHNSQFTYCQCREGFAGQFCEIDSIPCGTDSCYHGSTCVDGGDGFYCDCNVANSRNGGAYAGRFCQYEATAMCASNHNGLNFCVNDGKCVHDGNGIFSCSCSDGFHGPKCEFPDDQPSDDEEYEGCTLQCSNLGKCRKGAKDTIDTTLTDVSPDVLDDLKATHNDDFEHCVCPTGFSGLTCDVEAESCGDGEHLCLHGSTCDRTPGGKWTCNCADAFSADRKVAGQFCQHHHTSTCTPDSQPAIYTGPTSFAFCVNDGVCVEIVEQGENHAGCRCPDLYTGQHCELLKATHPGVINPPIPVVDDETTKGGSFVYVVLGLALVMLGGAGVFLRRLKARERRRREVFERSQIQGKLTGPASDNVVCEEEFDEIELL